eukprot:9490006-Pyramimonas_sp.AAC.1
MLPPNAPGAPRPGHVQSVSGTLAHVTAHIAGDGSPARSRQYADTPTVPVEKQYKVPAGLANMTPDFAPKYTVWRFLPGM